MRRSSWAVCVAAAVLAWGSVGCEQIAGLADKQFGAGAGTTTSSAGGGGGSTTPPGPAEWSRSFGGTGSDLGSDVATGSDGSVVVVGSFEDIIDFGGDTATSSGSSDGFVMKLDASGERLWSYGFGGTEGEALDSVAVDGAGDVLVAGGTSSPDVNFGCGTLAAGAAHAAGGAEVVVAKLSGSDGHCLWSRRFGAKDQRAHVSVDDAGAVTLATSFGAAMPDPVAFGGDPLTGYEGSVAIVRLDAAGTHVWSEAFGATVGVTEARDVTTHDDGSITFVGTTATTSIDFGGGPLTGGGEDDDMIVVRRDSVGAHVWAKRFGVTGLDFGKAVAATSDGGVVVVGGFEESVDFGGGALVSRGYVDIVVLVLDASGNHQLSVSFGGSTFFDEPFAVAAFDDGDIVVGGYFTDNIDFGTGLLTAPNDDGGLGLDAFALRLDDTGGARWAYGFGGIASGDSTQGVALTPDGKIAITGEFSGTIRLGPADQEANGVRDGFVALLPP